MCDGFGCHCALYIASYKPFYSKERGVETLSLLFVPPLGGGMEIIMNESTVKISMKNENQLDCSYAIITKDLSSVIIILRNRECGIFDYSEINEGKSDCKYLLLKHYDSEETAYKDFLKLIGKMCKKSKESKYFGVHKNEDNRMVADSFGERMINEDDKCVYESRYNEFIDCIINLRW